jgi:hypothetical protein
LTERRKGPEQDHKPHRGQKDHHRLFSGGAGRGTLRAMLGGRDQSRGAAGLVIGIVRQLAAEEHRDDRRREHADER